MLEEPFWLGLIAVAVVMSIIGVCYLFKKHLPDKFDKMLSTSDPTKNPALEGQVGKFMAVKQINKDTTFKVKVKFYFIESNHE